MQICMKVAAEVRPRPLAAWARVPAMTTTDTTAEPAYEPPAVERRQAVGEALIGDTTSSDPPGTVISAHFEK